MSTNLEKLTFARAAAWCSAWALARARARARLFLSSSRSSLSFSRAASKSIELKGSLFHAVAASCFSSPPVESTRVLSRSCLCSNIETQHASGEGAGQVESVKKKQTRKQWQEQQEGENRSRTATRQREKEKDLRRRRSTTEHAQKDIRGNFSGTEKANAHARVCIFACVCKWSRRDAHMQCAGCVHSNHNQ